MILKDSNSFMLFFGPIEFRDGFSEKRWKRRYQGRDYAESDKSGKSSGDAAGFNDGRRRTLDGLGA